MMILKTKQKPFFHSSFNLFGYIGLIIGFIFLFFNPIKGAIILTIASPFVFFRTGILIDTKQKQAKEYVRIYGYLLGQWKSIEDYRFITLIFYETSINVLPGHLSSFSRDQSSYYYIYILNENHKRKFLVEQTKTKKEATQKLQILAKALHFEIVKYNPQDGIKIKNGDISSLYNKMQH